jgi:hypothetical protein
VIKHEARGGLAEGLGKVGALWNGTQVGDVARDMWLAGLQRGLELAKERAFLTSDRPYDAEYIDWSEVEKAIERE